MAVWTRSTEVHSRPVRRNQRSLSQSAHSRNYCHSTHAPRCRARSRTRRTKTKTTRSYCRLSAIPCPTKCTRNKNRCSGWRVRPGGCCASGRKTRGGSVTNALQSRGPLTPERNSCWKRTTTMTKKMAENTKGVRKAELAALISVSVAPAELSPCSLL